jgi:hypothetical protein
LSSVHFAPTHSSKTLSSNPPNNSFIRSITYSSQIIIYL